MSREKHNHAEKCCCGCDQHHHDDRYDHHDHHGCECGCACGHGENASLESGALTALSYAIGAIPVIIGFMSFIPYRIPLVAALVGYALFGYGVWKKMLISLSQRRIFTEFTLMCVATLGAFAIGEYADAAAVMYLYSLGETVSSRAYSKSKGAISELLSVSPEYATVIRGDQALRLEPKEVDVGETLLVRAGERTPLDGVVASGGGVADTSSITGESKPLELYEGVFCPSGAIITDGSVSIEASSRYEESMAYRLTRAVESATKRKSSSERLISRFARVFTPIAFCVALLVFLIGALITGNARAWLKSAIMVLVVSCPCSLVLSVPLTYFAGMGKAARRGIIFRGGEVMDSAARIDTVAFDKTGTITESRLSFDGYTLYSDMSESEFESLAYSALIHSPHAAAISFCEGRTPPKGYTARDIRVLSGRGMICEVENKTAVFGNNRLMLENGIEAPDSDITVIYGAYDGKLVGRLEFSSRLKSGIAETVNKLEELGVERIAVISGDTERSVEIACEAAGIKESYGGLSPDEKLGVFETMKSGANGGGRAAYCGDGLNDSAVISAADVGIAMGSCGSALTVESADVVLMDDDPSKICDVIAISRRTERIAISNIILSLGIKAGVLALGIIFACLSIDIPIELAIVADVGAAVLAVLNSLRALK